MILRHYAPYIAFCAKRSFYDDYGSRYEIVDEDIRQRIETKLMIQIIYKFDPYWLLANEQLWRYCVSIRDTILFWPKNTEEWEKIFLFDFFWQLFIKSTLSFRDIDERRKGG